MLLSCDSDSWSFRALTLTLNDLWLVVGFNFCGMTQMRRYEEVIELCEQTLGSAERNSYPIDASDQSSNLDGSKLSKYCYFRMWRCRITLKSHFHLGRLEDGLSLLEKQEEKLSATYR